VEKPLPLSKTSTLHAAYTKGKEKVSNVLTRGPPTPKPRPSQDRLAEFAKRAGKPTQDPNWKPPGRPEDVARQ